MSETLIEIEGYNGDHLTIAGAGVGAQGSVLGTNVNGIWDAPVKTIQNSTARQTGSSPGGHRNLQRDISILVHTVDTPGSDWESNDARLRKAFSYTADSKLWVTKRGSRRYLKVRLAEQPGDDPEIDPEVTQWCAVTLKLVAHDPWWYEDDIVSEWISTTDTTGGSTAVGFVPVSNPTDNTIWFKWRAQGPARWTIPDYSFGSNDFRRAVIDATKLILTPTLLTADGHGRIDTNPESRRRRISTTTDTQWQARFGGVDFLYGMPPDIPTVINLPVRVTGAPAGVGIQCIQPRPFSRAWR